MKDGTIEYMIIDNNQFFSQGTLSDVKDVVKFYTVDYNIYYNVWAQRSDGKIYVLGDIINKLYLDN